MQMQGDLSESGGGVEESDPLKRKTSQVEKRSLWRIPKMSTENYNAAKALGQETGGRISRNSRDVGPGSICGEQSCWSSFSQRKQESSRWVAVPSVERSF